MRVAERDLGTGEISEMLGLSRPVISKRLRALQVEGFVRWVGKSAQDPRAVWTIVDGS